MLEEVEQRLAWLGYDLVDGDRYGILFAIDQVGQMVQNECHLSYIPEGLHHVVVDMVCGEFLFLKKGCGQLSGFHAESAVKSIKEGDTQVTYGVSDGASPLDSLIDHLKNSGRGQLQAFRRLSW